MKVSTDKPGVDINFNSLSPLELWEKLGLAQPSGEKKSTGDFFSPPSSFQDEESRMAFEAFLSDCDMVPEEEQEAVPISKEKGSLFIWALLEEESKRSEKLSSVNHLFKDDVFKSAIQKGKSIEVDFDEEDFDEISSYLEEKHLIRTATEAIRITRYFTALFHKKYGAWLVF